MAVDYSTFKKGGFMRQKQKDNFSLRLRVVGGNLTAKQLAKIAEVAENFGDTRTLVIHPSSTIYAHSTEQQKENAGVFDDTIRISVGIEDIADLIEDFGNAISKINN